MPTIRISDDTADRLKKLARPLNDSWDTFLGRAGLFLTQRQSEFLSFDQEQNGVRPVEVTDTPPRPPEARFVARLSPSVRELYQSVRSLMVSLGDDIQVGAVPSCEYSHVSVNGRQLVHIHRRVNGLTLFLRPDGLEVEKGTKTTLHNVWVERPANPTWPHNAVVRVSADTDLDGLRSMLRDVYDATKNRGG